MDTQLDLYIIIGKHGSQRGDYGQIVQFGSSRPEVIIINLVVFDGEKTRGQREALLQDNVKQIGVAFGT